MLFKKTELFDRGDLYLGVALSVAVLFVVLALCLVLYDEDLLCAAGLLEDGLHLCSVDDGSADGRVLAVVDEEHLVKNDLVTGFEIAQVLDTDHVAYGDRILLAPCGYNCEFSHTALYYTIKIRSQLENRLLSSPFQNSDKIAATPETAMIAIVSQPMRVTSLPFLCSPIT